VLLLLCARGVAHAQSAPERDVLADARKLATAGQYGAARAMLEASRASDDLSRIGGEEFGITVPDVDVAVLRSIADRMCSLVGRTTVRAGGRDLAVTVSIGGTSAVAGDTPATVFERADRALYVAKEEGRNRVVIL